MRKFKISRSFVTRLEWTVEATSEAEALKMLDNEKDETPTDEASEEWLGPMSGVLDQCEDLCEKM